MQVLTSKEINKIAAIQGSCLCFRTLDYTNAEVIATYHQISFTTDELGLLDKIYGCKEDFEITDDEPYYLIWNKLDSYRKDYYLLNLVNLYALTQLHNKFKLVVLVLFCYVCLLIELMYELAKGQQRTFGR